VAGAAFIGVCIGVCALTALLPLRAAAELPAEAIGATEMLPAPPQPHWVFASDALLRRSALIDLEADRMLGVIDGGFGITTPVVSPDGRTIYLPETHFSRGSRGERTDVVTFYDSRSLAPTAEVVIPPKRAMNILAVANASLSDDGRFLAVFNMTPATSLSIVDTQRRQLAGEIATPGCSLVYAAGTRRFLMLCADGSLLTVRLDDDGRLRSKQRSAPFFDPEQDPVTEKAVRDGERWLFASFEGWIHAVDFSGPEPRVAEPWSLLDDADRADSWRIGGSQHLAIHRASNRLYSLVHQGGVDSHKDPGSELWVYDLATRKRIQRIELKSPGLTYLGVSMEFGSSWIWPFNQLYDALLSQAPELGVANIAVTQDDEPLLVAGSDFSGSLALYDALTGRFLRRVTTGNLTTVGVQAPW
jgi:methylamine dehydrogenase heavy chain